MTKKAAVTVTGAETLIKYDSQSLMAIALKVKAEGFVPVADLRVEFGAENVTKAQAVLYRDYRLFREVRRAWRDKQDALGYEWADQRFSQAQIKKIPPALGFIVELMSAVRPKYGDFEEVASRCRMTTPILGSVPVKDKDGDPTNKFERDAGGRILILPYHQRAMSSAALPMIGKEQAIARRIGFSTIRITPNGNLGISERGIVDPGGYGGGKGLRRSEHLLDPVDFTIRANVPTSVLAMDEYLRMLTTAGRFVRLSPGRSAGFGEFEVLGAE